MCELKQRFDHWPSVAEGLKTWVLHVPPESIGRIAAIVESHENVLIIRTRDHAMGLIDLWIMPGQESIAASILKELEEDIPIARVREEDGHPDLR